MPMQPIRWLVPVFLLAACGAEREPRAAAADSTAAPAAVVDSTFPPDEALRRFREGLADPRELGGGAESKEALVRGFVAALARRDTAAVIAMHQTRDEFAWLYYPEAPLSRPGPQYLDPKTMWLLLRLESEKGLTRLMQRLGGSGAELGALRCEPEPRVEGPNRLWEQCRVELRGAPQGFTTQRLFGTILERGGVFKFVSYKTGL